MKPLRVTISGSVLAAVLLAFFFLPLPVSRVRETGVVQVLPEDIVQVHVEVPGVLDKIMIKEGQKVHKGTILAEFHNPEMQSQMEELKSKYEIQKRRVDAYAAYVQLSPELAKAKQTAETERDSAWKQWQYYANNPIRRLILKAPRAGTAMGVPMVEDIGKRWDPEQDKPFCSIGEPHKLRILVPVSPDNYDLIRTDLEYFKKRGENMEVTIRVHGRDSHLWKGRVTHLPRSRAEEIPVPLSNKAGGPLAIKPTSQPQHPVPQNQVYLVGIDILNPDGAISPGILAQVKIHCRYRTCGWWAWRWISSVLDLGLI